MYVREFGSPTRVMTQSSIEDKLKSLVKNNEEQQWRDILKAAENNAVLAEMLVQAKLLYLLSKEDDNIPL